MAFAQNFGLVVLIAITIVVLTVLPWWLLLGIAVLLATWCATEFNGPQRRAAVLGFVLAMWTLTLSRATFHIAIVPLAMPLVYWCFVNLCYVPPPERA